MVEEKKLKSIDTAHYNVSEQENGLIYVVFKEGTDITIDLLEEMIDVYNQITGGKHLPFLYEVEPYVTISKEARDYSVKIEKRKPISASAVYVDNIAYAIIVNFYMKFNRPHKPFKMFNKRDEAIKWLLSYQEK